MTAAKFSTLSVGGDPAKSLTTKAQNCNNTIGGRISTTTEEGLISIAC